MSSEAATQERSGANGLVIRSAIVASIGGLIFGFDTAVISGTTKALERVYELGDFGLGLTVAIATVGTIIGALISGNLADRYGRKKMLFVIGAFYVLGALGTALSPDNPAGHGIYAVQIPGRHRYV